MGKKEKRIYGKGGEVNYHKLKEESGSRIRNLRQRGFERVRDVTAIENAGLPLGKRNRRLRRQPLRRHK